MGAFRFKFLDETVSVELIAPDRWICKGAEGKVRAMSRDEFFEAFGLTLTEAYNQSLCIKHRRLVCDDCRIPKSNIEDALIRLKEDRD